MKTSIRSAAPENVIYSLHDLENEAEMSVLIKEAETRLSPCAHCGFCSPIIAYEYHTELDWHCHFFNVWCMRLERVDEIECKVHGCKMMTFAEQAYDDNENNSIKAALDRVVCTWNRRPCYTIR